VIGLASDTRNIPRDTLFDIYLATEGPVSREILIFMVVPPPGRLVTSKTPLIFSMFVLTTSMPTPRPEMPVTF
jgi:hypothetical protein